MNNQQKLPLDTEIQAQNLMNELFSDIEEITDEDNAVIQTVAELEEPSLSSVTAESASLEKVDQDVQELYQSTVSDAFFADVELISTPKKAGLFAHLDKLLFISSITCLFAVICWLVSQEKLKIPLVIAKVEQPTIIENQVSAQDQKFAAYLLQSLKKIEQENSPQPTEQLNPKKSDNSGPINVTNIPKNPQTKIVERIYIPIFPPEQNPTIPNQPISPPVNVNTAPIAPPPPPTATALIPPPPITIKPATISPVTTPEVNINQLIPPVTKPTPIVATTPNSTLVGLLELGDKSAALFELNGITERIYLGEAIGTTGWQLTSIANQQVTISRNGEEKSIYVGQKF